MSHWGRERSVTHQDEATHAFLLHPLQAGTLGALGSLQQFLHFSQKVPLLTVVIPTCNRLADLARCLESLTPGKQEGIWYPEKEDNTESRKVKAEIGATRCLRPAVSAPDAVSDQNTSRSILPSYHVIVTDDGSDLAAKAMIQDRFPWAEWTQGPRRGPAANRNHGGGMGKGEWLVFIDDDCVATPSWLQAIAQYAANSSLDVIEGRTIIPCKRDSPFLHGVENENGGCYWSCNLAVRQETFWRIGGFDEDFAIAGGEDLEFACRFQRQGLRAIFAADALVLHPQSPRPPFKVLKRMLFDMKWYRLFLLKIGQSPPLSAGGLRVTGNVVAEHVNRVTRQSLGTLLGAFRPGWKTSFFNVFFLWLFMPLQLPYQVWWEFKFRHSLQREKPASSGAI